MDDTEVDFFLETLKNLITSSDLTINEKQQLESLEEKIEYLRGFLKVTEKKRNECSEVIKLVKQIRDVVSKAGNIVQQFVLDSVKDDASCSLGDVKKEIKTLTDEVMQIYDHNMYDINGVEITELKHSSTGSGGIGGSSSSGGRHTFKLGEEKVVVGFEKEVETLIQRLDNKGVGLEIISIIGAAGGGKSTLAREVYEHPFTSHTFEIRAWANVSQEYDETKKKELNVSQEYDETKKKKELLLDILKYASSKKRKDLEKSNEDQLGEELHKCLKGRKYLIVMDDIWGIKAWNDIQRSFPRERKGSKVLFTSRFGVQPDGISCVPHYLAPLPSHCSWKLLAKKVFGMKGCPKELEGIGEQIAGKCEGLPLEIVAIAGILAAEEKTLDKWNEIAKRLSLIIANNNPERCMDILELSYNHLPLHLKKCFVYIGGFPEDYEIPVRKLIWLWVVKGFIEQCEGGKSLEAIAEDYLIGLVDRSLVTVARRSYLGEIKAIRVHDLWRILCLKKAKENEFFVPIYEEGDSISPFMDDFRRKVCLDSLEFIIRKIRFHFSGLSSFSSGTEIQAPSGTKIQTPLLAYFCSVPVCCCCLPCYCCCLPFYCCYCCFVIGNCCFAIGNSLGRDEYFHTITLPHNIFKMVELRHLYSKEAIFKYHLSHISSKKAARNPSKLNSLQTLHPLCPCKDCQSFLVRTPNLKKLGFYGKLLSRDGVLRLPDLEFLKCLETLSFNNSRFYSKFRGGSSLPAGLKLPPTTTRLTLKGTLLNWEELSILQTLPSLEVLKLLEDACRGQVWNAKELEGFFQLKYLRFEYLDIVEWNASEDQFPRLEVLVIEHCYSLKQIPIDFANLNELREIKLEYCTQSAEDSGREIQEEQRNKKGEPLDPSCIFSTCNLSVGVIGKPSGSMVALSMGMMLGLEFGRYV